MSRRSPRRGRTGDEGTPDADDARKPDSLSEIDRPSWRFTARAAVAQFSSDACADLAAGLTYRTVMSMFPGLIALVSILSLFGQSGQTVTDLLDQLKSAVPSSTWDSVRPALDAVLAAPAPGIGLIVGLITALWSASGYVKAFGRAMNRIYEVPEGRGAIKINAQMYGLTALILVLGAAGLLTLVVSGPVTEAIGTLLGIGPTVMMIWDVLKWFVLAFIVVLVIALLYYATPNVKQPKFRWVSVGAVIAILVAVAASAGFFFYVSNFGKYNATYGALAGVIILLLWLYIVNAILLLGAEIDSELERARELQADIAAESVLQLPARDTRASDKRARKRAEQIDRARSLRPTPTPEDDDAENTR
ncbi:MAG: YihY/virulence factor BrkB family protein [Acidipropionibacterium acidipropionici]|nr:YihY/virulence factor BrkB family protein [Acidipropionibacterium acidipropionici]